MSVMCSLQNDTLRFPSRGAVNQAAVRFEGCRPCRSAHGARRAGVETVRGVLPAAAIALRFSG